MKHYFFGKYYKFVSPNGYSFALIDSYSNEGKEAQIITKESAYFLQDLSQIKIEENRIIFNVILGSFSLEGEIEIIDKHPLKHNAMGPFKVFSMECSHDVYSMYHCLKGTLKINGIAHNFDDGYGYIEGDKGKSFPSKYIWYNSIGKDYGVTFALATIPFGFIHFTGLLGFISYKGKEYYLCTYTFAKAIKISEKEIVIKKGKYSLTINIDNNGGHLLKAPDLGKMSRRIKENVALSSHLIFKKKEKIILEKDDDYSSFEYMWK